MLLVTVNKLGKMLSKGLWTKGLTSIKRDQRSIAGPCGLRVDQSWFKLVQDHYQRVYTIFHGPIARKSEYLHFLQDIDT